ncbi:MAG TPA: TonB-dependent receptor [Bryobacteraceae bacterium]
MSKQRCIARAIQASAVCLFFVRIAVCQNITATVLGTVTDPSGASVPSAEVVLTDVSTNQQKKTTTNDAGHYEVPYLKPGTYDVKVSSAGFKTMIQQGVVLLVDSNLRLDFTLQVGDAATSVSVSAEGPLVESQTASLGQVVTTKSVQNLPIKGRDLFDLAILSPGVAVNPLALGTVASTGNNTAPLFVMSDMSINGGRYRTNDFLLDGVSIMLPENNDFALSPTPDGTQEFKIMTNGYGPQFGRSGGGVINVVTKSGTNEWHGTAYEFFRDNYLAANNYFANAQGQSLPSSHFNLFGGALGAPIIKDKTFFFVEYQGHRQEGSVGGQLLTLPTAAQRAGDFSQTKASNGAAVSVYDPYSTIASGSGYVRTPYAGNRIPASEMDPVALKMLSYIPLPNRTGQGPALVNNYAWSQNQFIGSDQWSVRIDHRFSDRHSIFGRITRNTGDSGNSGAFNNPADNTLGIDLNRVFNGVINDTLTLSPTFLLNLRAGVSRRYEGRAPLHGDFPLTNLGFSDAFASQVQQQSFPQIAFTNYSQWGDVAGDPIRRGNTVYTLVGDTTLIRGRHTFIMGADVRLYDQTPFQASADNGSFSFSPGFTQGPNPLQSSLTSGSDFASFLVGYGSGTFNYVPAIAVRNWYWALYFNDEVKLGRLTLNAGLRYEYAQPPTERYNRFSDFDFNAPFPIQVAGLPDLQGTVTHPGQNGLSRGQFDPFWGSLGPRIGLAYSVDAKTAIRASYGIYYAPRFGTTSASGFGTAGATLTATWVSSLNGVTPLNPLSNPFPTGLFPPSTSLANQLLVGQSISVMDPNNVTNTYAQQWNFTIQRELPGQMLFEIGYAGNKGTHLPVSVDFDQINPVYQSLGANLTKQVPNPFYGLVSSGTLSTPTVAMSQLLRPYPQYLSVNTNSSVLAQNEADSSYNALEVKLNKRFSQGLSFLVSYTKGKVIDNASGRIFSVTAGTPPVQNSYDLSAERSVSPGDVAQQLVISHTLELPFGHGKRWLGSGPKLVDVAVGGWSLSGTLTASSGFPLELTSNGNSGVGSAVLRPNSTGQSAKLGGSTESRLGEFFNTSVFTIPATYTFGNVSRALPDVRAPGRFNYDLALEKHIPLKERVSALFRAEAFNLTNSPYFGAPGQNLGSANFGVISSSTGERQVQLALKIIF